MPGLTQALADERLAEDGPNELPSAQPRTAFRSAIEVLREPMLLLLLIAGGLYFVLGDLQEALTLCVAIIVVIAITVVQSRRTENALSALRDLSSPMARVLRDGELRRVPARELVRGDHVLVAEGDRVPADGYLREVLNVEVDESLLTGESVPVRKQAGSDTRTPLPPPGGDDQPSIYSGTLLVRGQGRFEVAATGAESAMGKIGSALATVEVGRTPLQRQVGRLVAIIGGLAIAACGGLVLALGLTTGDWVEAVLAGVALAMSLLPEEFPVVLTVFLALGAWRLTRVKVLTRRMPALETLGAATVLCADKTGTLTENRMRVVRLEQGDHSLVVGDESELPEEFHEVVEFGILASQSDPHDPMERAFIDLGQQTLEGTEHLHSDWTLEREYPLSPQLLAMSHVWSAPDNARYVIAAKGAPEAIIDLCHLPGDERLTLEERIKAMASDGLRVLAAARAYFEPGDLPDDQHDFDFEFLGLIGLADPVRAAVPDAIASCYRAGIRVIMITGDYPETARAIGAHAGLHTDRPVLTGAEVAELDDAQLEARLADTTIIARAVPEQKLRIVNKLREAGEIVAMTGDGVNDAPALKAAHIGVAMGQRGTDVAREAAEIVVTDDDFSSIVGGVRTGRHIQDNLRRALAYVVAVHVPIATAALAPILLGWPLMLLPVHIALLELIIDPASAIAFEAEPAEPGIMRRPPRSAREPLFGRVLLGWSLLQGASVAAAVLGIMAWLDSLGAHEDRIRTAGFVALIAGNLMLVLVNRSWERTLVGAFFRRNVAAWLITAGAGVFLAVALVSDWVRGLLHFTLLDASTALTAVGAGVASLLWFELLKLVRPKALGAART